VIEKNNKTTAHNLYKKILLLGGLKPYVKASAYSHLSDFI
jgi:hypothetical protein